MCNKTRNGQPNSAKARCSFTPAPISNWQGLWTATTRHGVATLQPWPPLPKHLQQQRANLSKHIKAGKEEDTPNPSPSGLTMSFQLLQCMSTNSNGEP
eukprot:2931232-Rhodomonas_salina.1